jgi:hypothetical protein
MMAKTIDEKRLTQLLLGIAFAAVILQIIDKSLNSSLFASNNFPPPEIIIFGLLAVASIAMQFMLIYGGKRVAMIGGGRSLFASIFHKSIIILEGFLCALLLLIFLQSLFVMSYSVTILEISIGTSLIVSSVILAILASRFLRTLRYIKNRVVLAYMVATAVLSLNAIVTFTYIEFFLTRRPEVITSKYNTWTSFGSFLPDSIAILYQLIGIMSFATFWIATLLLTRHYATKTGTIRYWVLISIPLVYFASQFLISYVEDLNSLRIFRIENTSIYSYLYNLFLNTARIAGGVLFGFALFAIARRITHIQLRDSIIIAGIGLIVLAGVNSTLIIIMTDFPPWGVLSISFSIAGSYCLMIGLDSAAFYVASDSSLRRFIQRLPTRSLDLLRSLSFTKIQDMIANRVEGLSDDIYDEIDRNSLFTSISEPSNVKAYVDEVLKEVHRDKSSADKENGKPQNGTI